MIKKDDGGRAFPVQVHGAPLDGMSLRDYFAAQALMGVFVGPEFDDEDNFVAKRCYQIADAMLKARQG